MLWQSVDQAWKKKTSCLENAAWNVTQQVQVCVTESKLA
jgi:hypothetical protein